MLLDAHCTEAAILAWLEDRAATEEGQEIGAAARKPSRLGLQKYCSPESLDILELKPSKLDISLIMLIHSYHKIP